MGGAEQQPDFGTKLKNAADSSTKSFVDWARVSVNGKLVPALKVNLHKVGIDFNVQVDTLTTYLSRWHFKCLTKKGEAGPFTVWYREGFHQHCNPSALDHKSYSKTKTTRKPAAAPNNKGKKNKAAAQKRAARLRSDTAALEAAEAEKRKARYAASAPGKRRRIDTDRATAANDDSGNSATNTPPRPPPRSPPSANGGGGSACGDGRSGEGDDDRETNADSSGDEIIMMNGNARPASTGRRTGGAGSDGQPLADYIFNDGAGNKPPVVCRVEQAAREFTRLQEECDDARAPHVALCLRLSECVPSDGDFESLRTSMERQKECRRNLGAAEDELLRRLRELREVADKARNLLRTDGGGGSSGGGSGSDGAGKGGGSAEQNGSGTGAERDASKSTTDPNGADIAPAGSGAAGNTGAPTSNGAANNVDASLLSTGGSGRLDAAEAPRKRSQGGTDKNACKRKRGSSPLPGGTTDGDAPLQLSNNDGHRAADPAVAADADHRSAPSERTGTSAAGNGGSGGNGYDVGSVVGGDGSGRHDDSDCISNGDDEDLLDVQAQLAEDERATGAKASHPVPWSAWRGVSALPVLI